MQGEQVATEVATTEDVGIPLAGLVGATSVATVLNTDVSATSVATIPGTNKLPAAQNARIQRISGIQIGSYFDWAYIGDIIRSRSMIGGRTSSV